MKYPMFHILFVTTILLAGCGHAGTQRGNLSDASTQDLIRLLEDTKDNSDLFPDVIKELATRGSIASDAAPALARALAYNRRDSTIASRPLVAMGSTAKSAIPILVENLKNQRAEVRLNSVFVLGIIGAPSQCAIPHFALLLWDQDPAVRSAVASSIQAITGEVLVAPTQELDPTLPGSVFLDEPEGHISSTAREWWLRTGQNMVWPSESCELPN